MKKGQNTLTGKIWLVKASETIMGPYSLDELALALRAKKIGLLDEAKTNTLRWLYIRDIPELQSAVLELANEAETIEKTHTAAHTQVSVTRKLVDELTPTPPRPINYTKPLVAETPSPIPASNASIKIEPIKSYSLTPSAEPINMTKWILHSLVGISIVAALFAFWQKQNWESRQKKTWSQVQQLYASKLYQRAYDTFKDYQQALPEQAVGLMRLGMLHLNPGHDLVKSKRFFEMSSQLDPKNKDLTVQNLNGLALVSLYDGQTSNARTYLERALALEPGNVATKLNLIALQMNQSKWNDAMNAAQMLVSQEPRKSHLIQAIIIGLSDSFKGEIPGLLSALKATADQSLYLRAEMKLMALHLATLSNSKNEITMALESFFRDIPVFAMEFSEDPSVDQRWRDWNYLYQFCSDIDLGGEAAAEVAAVRIVCLSQVKRWTEAEKLLNESLVRFPSHPKLLLAQLHLLTLMGRWPEVRGLSRIPNLIQEDASQWYFAKTCFEEGQDACVDSYLNAHLQKASVKTYYYALKAKQKCRQRALDGCRFLLSQGLAQDPISTELLNLRYDLEESL